MKRICRAVIAFAVCLVATVVGTLLIGGCAKHDAETYSVTFDLNYDGAEYEYVIYDVGRGSTIQAPTAPEREGYEFKAWWTSADESGAEWNFATDTVTDDITLYAHWTEKVTPPVTEEYTVTFNYNDGATADAEVETVDGKIAEPATPVREGYTFDGWYTAAEGGEKFNFDSAVTENITLYAHWTENVTPPIPAEEYTVTFNYNDGVTADKTEKTVDGKIAEPVTPVREGYEFDGWYTAAEGGEKFNFDSAVTEDITLYAHWTENVTPPIPSEEYTVTFNYNDGATADKTAKTVDGKVAEPATPVRDGYTFDGWYTAAEGGDKFNFNSTVTADITLYAHWTKKVTPPDTGEYEEVVTDFNMQRAVEDYGNGNTYTGDATYGQFTFGSDDGKAKFEQNSGNYVWNSQGNSITIVLGGIENSISFQCIRASNSGETVLTFFKIVDGKEVEQSVNWSPAGTSGYKSYSVTGLEAGTYVIKTSNAGRIKDLRITEKYIKGTAPEPVKEFTVTFNLNGGQGDTPAKQTVVEGGYAIQPETIPVRDGYTFDGWYTAVEDGNLWEFNVDRVVGDITLYAHWSANTYKVTFNLNYTNAPAAPAPVEDVKHNSLIEAPAAPQRTGYTFIGWHTAADNSGYEWDFEVNTVTSNLTLYAHWQENNTEPGEDDPVQSKIISSYGGYNESAYAVFEDKNIAGAAAYYKKSNLNSWNKVDAPLIRAISSNEARVDILGLAAGNYDIKIVNSENKTQTVQVAVAAYDRSGYAHFNYTDGVGAYKDDGTLKDNALVIYVTEENKDTVMDEVCAANDDIEMFKIPYSGNGKDWGDKTASGIGWWLNNNQYTSNNAGSSSNKRPSNTYDAVNGGKLGFKSVDRPIVIRFIGEVTTPEGCTALDEDEGGINGDNGHMARMKNLKNVTLEGVGEDAVIKGWGFHFIAGTDAVNGQGTSFEVRNLTFSEYPEDAIGMEGQQSGSTITASVERCWIHNNTFLPGYCADPKESDKKEGDGSCDFKRGQYFTASYNWFEYCHKTNLIGSSDSSLQYNMTYHHNVWWQCGSRIPLTRQANVHFYNNYVYVNAADTSSPYSWVKVSPSYVHSLRANCYLFSEANYYDGAKNITDGKNGGAAKGWNNVYYGNYGTNTIEDVTSRTQQVSNKCAYNGIDYSKFDTDSTLFYYKDGKSDCLLDDAVTARQKALMYAGANGHGVTDVKDTAMNYYTPDGAVSVVESGTEISLPTAKGDSTINGVLFKGITGVSSGTIKYKGQGITFTLTAQAQLTVTTTTTGDPAPELVGADGYVYAHKFEGTLTIVLEPGTYFIASGQKDKEVVISSLRFDDTKASSAARVEAAVAAINALPATAALTDDFATALKAAQNAYSALTSSEQTKFNADYSALVTKLNTLAAEYGELQIRQVRQLIEAIGTVTENSYDAISAAQTAYDKLTSEQKAQLTSEKAILDAAWADFEQYEVLNVINMIKAFVAKVNALDENNRAAVEALLAEGETVQTAYDLLSTNEEGGESQQAQVTNYNDFVAAMAKIESVNNIFAFRDQLAYFEGHTVTMADASEVAELQRLYDALTGAQKSNLTQTERALYEKVLADFGAAKPNIIYAYFTRAGGNSGAPVINTTEEGQDVFSFIDSCNGGNDGGTITTSDGQTVTLTNGLKLESKTQFGISLGTGTATVKFYMAGSNGVTVNGTAYSATNKIVTVTGLSGNLTITRNGSDTLLYVEVIYD